MALYGLIAGIHGNREALAAALSALAARRAERIFCLGDVVGYNADPVECVELVRRRCAAALAGPHDLIALGRFGFDGCSTQVEYALRRTRRELDGDARSWLAGLPSSAALEDGTLLVAGELRASAAILRQDFPGVRRCFFGRSQQPKVYRIATDTLEEIPADGKVVLRREDAYFISPGAVDASRKRSHKLAECALFDSVEGSVEFLAAPYDGAATEAKAAVFGYRIVPLTDRLYTLRRKLAART
jgi:hypothetical protein